MEKVLNKVLSFALVIILLAVAVLTSVSAFNSCKKYLKKWDNILTSATTIAEEYSIEDTATILEIIEGDKILLNYNDNIYKLQMINPLDYTDSNNVPITLKITQMQAGNVYSTITHIGDFEVKSCIKVNMD